MLLGSSAGGAHFSSSTSDEKAVTTTTGTTTAATAAATSTSTSSTSSAGVSSSGGYVQGMTILCAPFLFVMPEVRHYVSYFYKRYTHCIGKKHSCLKSCDTMDILSAECTTCTHACAQCAVLPVTQHAAVDPELHGHLSGRAGDIKIFAFPLLMSLHACMPPLEETLKVWDVLFAYGVHMEAHSFTAHNLSTQAVAACI
eukprot:2900-Heterococcus_DN1.PRE.2